jgi:hypothetical protein
MVGGIGLDDDTPDFSIWALAKGGLRCDTIE